jgi:Predicted membrane protein
MVGKNSLSRFAAVGLANTMIDFSVFSIMRAVFDVNYLWCQVAGYTAGIINSFVFNKVWTFESRTSQIHTFMQLVKFLLVNLASLGATVIGLKLLSQNGQVNVYIAKVIVTFAAQAINYSGYRFWVFPPSSTIYASKS